MFSRGSATVRLKKAISGPMKNAVMTVPIPTTPEMSPLPAIHRRAPASTQNGIADDPAVLKTDPALLFRPDQGNGVIGGYPEIRTEIERG